MTTRPVRRSTRALAAREDRRDRPAQHVMTRGADPRTLIGVLAARDSRLANMSMVSLFTEIHASPTNRARLERFHFVFTGGTYDRLFFGDPKLDVPGLSRSVSRWLTDVCGVTRLPPASAGGVTILSYLVTQRQCSIVWPFFAAEHHWLRPENLAFMRLCDQWHVKRLMNVGSVLVWMEYEADLDRERNLQPRPLKLRLRADEKESPTPTDLHARPPEGLTAYRPDIGAVVATWRKMKRPLSELTVALIAHDEMKSRMIEFAIDHEAELDRFKTILATGTTGREVAAATSRRIDSKVVRYHSGPKGGDIEIATEILHGHCQLVIFFVDPLRPHPHIEDIRTVFQACMLRDEVVMITNEMHAREFMSRVVRGERSSIDLYARMAETA